MNTKTRCAAPRAFTLNRCARAGRLPSRPHAGRLLVTTRPVREALAGMRAEPVYPGCGRYKRLGFAESFSASYFLRIAALERGKVCF